jgi:hypothetical protein
MLNNEINSRFNDWLINPSESLDFEVKGWVSPSTNEEHKGLIAKALIALENHGGGFLLIGYIDDGGGKLSPDQARPSDLSEFSVDEINNILKKFAEPPFHVNVTFQIHPESGEEYPLIQTSGKTKVPIRAAKGTQQQTIKKDSYYIRRPGPSSESPADGYEWDRLIQRCVLNQKVEIMETLREFFAMSYIGNSPTPDNNSKDSNPLINFCNSANSKWQTINAELSEDNPSKISYGYFSFGCEIEGVSKNLKTNDVLTSIGGLRRYTGWPILVALNNPDNRPYLADGLIEASLVKLQYPSSAHADFWRVDPRGFVYLLRGYQEDALSQLSETRNQRAPGTGLDLTLPVWRVAEFILRINELASIMFETGYSISMRCEWTGLKGRSLFSFNNRRMIFDGHMCKADKVETQGNFSGDMVQGFLPKIVEGLVSDLYLAFDFFVPPESFYAEEIELLKSGTII